MKLGLIDVDKTRFPNLALMKLSAAYKYKGAEVEWYNPKHTYNAVAASSVFNRSKKPVMPADAMTGGTGFNSDRILPEWVEHIMPDYSLYPTGYSMGFTTRGCPRKCEWCVVPAKEGDIVAHADYTEFTSHNRLVLLDNNILAHPHGIQQLEKLAVARVKLDITQGVDSRLVDDSMARLLAKNLWFNAVRMACDNDAAMVTIFKAVKLLRWHNCTPRKYFVYVLVRSVESAIERVRFLKALDVDIFCQPFMDLNDIAEPTREVRRFCRWANSRNIINTMSWEDYVEWAKHRI